MKEKIIAFVSVFGSTGTLFCCALPATIAAVAGGAAVAGFVSTFPWLIPLSQNKGWLFLGAGLLIAFNGVLTLRPRGAVACSITGGKGCEVAGKFSRVMFWNSIGIYAVGVFMSYAIVPIMQFLEG